MGAAGPDKAETMPAMPATSPTPAALDNHTVELKRNCKIKKRCVYKARLGSAGSLESSTAILATSVLKLRLDRYFTKACDISYTKSQDSGTYTIGVIELPNRNYVRMNYVETLLESLSRKVDTGSQTLPVF